MKKILFLVVLLLLLCSSCQQEEPIITHTLTLEYVDYNPVTGDLFGTFWDNDISKLVILSYNESVFMISKTDFINLPSYTQFILGYNNGSYYNYKY